MDPTRFSEIYEVPTDQRYWVIRADSGHYLSNFRVGSCVAVGHLDRLGLGESIDEPYLPDSDDLYSRIERIYRDEDKSKAQITSIANQVHKFLYDMKPGDLVLSPGTNTISVGRIVGLPRLNKTPISARASLDSDQEIVMRHNLRRKVLWGPLIRRHNLPFAVSRSLRANQTVFNVDDHWEAIHHLIYPIFMREGKTYLSFKVNQDEDINNFLVSRFLDFLSKTETFSELIPEIKNWDPVDFNKQFLKYAVEGEGSLTLKAHFMSRGEINTAFGGAAVSYIKETLTPEASKRLIYGICLYTALFGNTVVGFDGIIDLETRHLVRDYIAESWFNGLGDPIKDQLLLDMPNENTSSLEDNSADEIMPEDAAIPNLNGEEPPGTLQV